MACAVNAAPPANAAPRAIARNFLIGEFLSEAVRTDFWADNPDRQRGTHLLAVSMREKVLCSWLVRSAARSSQRRVRKAKMAWRSRRGLDPGCSPAQPALLIDQPNQ